MSAARSVLRRLVRTIDRNVTSQSGNNIWRRSAFDEFRRNANEIDADRTAQLVQEAADITFHLESVTAHKELLFTYNIGINREKEQLQKLSDSARAVGLSLPEFNN